jgi:hypothetical protein
MYQVNTIYIADHCQFQELELYCARKKQVEQGKIFLDLDKNIYVTSTSACSII